MSTRPVISSSANDDRYLIAGYQDRGIKTIGKNAGRFLAIFWAAYQIEKNCWIKTSSLRRFAKDHRAEFENGVKIPGFLASPKQIKEFLVSIQKIIPPAQQQLPPAPSLLPETKVSRAENLVRVTKARRVVRGKKNIGNSCYINSVNQILFNSKAFRAAARQELIRVNEEEEESFNDRKKITTAHLALLQLYKQGSDQEIEKAVAKLRQIIFNSTLGSDHGFKPGEINGAQSTRNYLELIFQAYGFNHFQTSNFIFEEGYEPHEEIATQSSSIGPTVMSSDGDPGNKTIQDLLDYRFRKQNEEGYYLQAKITGAPPPFLPIRMLGGANDQIELSEKPLDLSPYFFEKREGVLYDLVGFTRHTPGHWTNLVKVEGQWFLVDDSKVCPKTWEEVKSHYINGAWEIFYERSYILGSVKNSHISPQSNISN